MDSLSHPELVLLAFRGDGPAHAYELVTRVRSMEVERWARVPESTLYAVLRRLEERGWVRGEEEPGERGRRRTRYRRTDEGAARLDELLRRGLAHPAPLYSDRLVAALFASAEDEEEPIRRARTDVKEARHELDEALERTDLSEEGKVILRFYRGLADLHLEALEALEALAHTPDGAPPFLPDGMDGSGNSTGNGRDG